MNLLPEPEWCLSLVPELVEGRQTGVEFIESLTRASIKFKMIFGQIYVGVEFVSTRAKGKK